MNNNHLRTFLLGTLCILLCAALAACSAAPSAQAQPAAQPAAAAPAVSATEPAVTDLDFTKSPYKHITNGNVTDNDTLPYNIDAITGATQTVEGPAVRNSVPLSVREIENVKEGIARCAYTDSHGTFLYEGVDLYHMLTGMSEGDNGIILTDTAYSVTLMSQSREPVAVLTIDDVRSAHEAGRPVLIAYGIGTTDGTLAAPFVFDAKNEAEHSLGYIEELKNDDGCLKLVYDLDKYGDNDYTTFSNVAYLYLQEETESGFKHTTAADPVYASSRYADYLITFRGSALSREFVLPVKALEKLVSYNSDGSLVENGIGYADDYSLANNAYWYVNRYEGLDLYKLLQYLGMPSAETMGTAGARTTMVNFIAADGVPSTETFSVDTLSYPDVFGFYTKNAADPGDGTYLSTADDLVRTGYPVLLSYGVNNYPYTISKTDPGYLSGLSNSGGPLRVVFGKTMYNHANGSRQVQYLSEIIVGEDVLTNTHRHSDKPTLSALAESPLKVLVNSTDGSVLTDRTFTVGEVEDVIYGSDVAAGDKKLAKVKDTFQVMTGSDYQSDVYEGVSLEYFLMNTLGLQGTIGTVTFTGAQGDVKIDLSDAFTGGCNTELKRDGLVPMIAFAKNGAPMVAAKTDDGYAEADKLFPFLSSEPDSYRVDNAGGPLMLILPSTDDTSCNAVSVQCLTAVTIDLEPDAYAHIERPYSADASTEIRFYGEGLAKEQTFKLSELEGRQTQAQTLDYSIQNAKGSKSEARYRGLPVYDLLTEIGLNSNAGDVIFHSADGESVTIPLSLAKSWKYTNTLHPDKPLLCTMLAYGSGDPNSDDAKLGAPLVADDDSKGYVEVYDNDGGAMRLIVPQAAEGEANASLCLSAVVAVEVTANDVDTWSHSMSDVYNEYLPYEFTLSIKNDDSEWTHAFTVEQLEKLKQVIVRDTYSVLDIGECEGLDLWKFVKLIVNGQADLSAPVSVTVYASDGYKNDLLSVFYLEGLEKGVLDADGNRKPILISYAFKGYPLVDSQEHEGYTGIAGNASGPLRCVAETVQGASVKYLNKLVITLPGAGNIDIQVDDSLFQ